MNSPASRQRGSVMVLFVVGMIAILGMVGLGLDTGNFVLENTRLQNTLDAAALAGAKSLAETGGDTTTATLAVNQAFAGNADNAGHASLNSAYQGGQLTTSVQFSNTLLPFVPGSAPARYVRVTGSNYRVGASFLQLIGFDEANLASTAVAGPSPRLTKVCNIAPMMVCGDPAAATAGDPFLGYAVGEPDVLKTSTTNGNFEVGPGNFQLVRLPGSSGGADIRTALAGDFNACVDVDDSVDTEPGNTIGPVSQGLNTRFGMYSGPVSQSDYPPDVIVKEANHGLAGNQNLDYDPETDEISYDGAVLETEMDMQAAGLYSYTDYQFDLLNDNLDNEPLTGSPPGPGAYGRRTLALPVGDCSVSTNGQGSLPLMGVLCFHLLQAVEQKGNDAYVFGQFVGDGCGVTGNPGDEPNDEAGPFIIQLYKDPDTTAS